MHRVYVLEQGTYLRKSGNSLVLMKDKTVVDEVSLPQLEHLVLAGFISLSGAVINALVQHRVETVLLDRHFGFRARLHVDEHKHVQRRQNQYVQLNYQEFSVQTARSIVSGKLSNQARFLQIRGQQSQSNALLSWAQAIKAIARSISAVPDMDLLRGAEGHGSRLYFQAFAHLVKNPGFSFQGRNRRPPLDPVNALLSFCYTLLTNEVLTAIKIVGLDPYLGSLHEVAYGRPSLACDLVEEWRTFVVDRLVLGLINTKSIRPEDFVTREQRDVDFVDEQDLKAKRPVELKPGPRKALVEAYETWMNRKIQDPYQDDSTTYRQHILRQVRHFSAYLNGDDAEYKPFPWSTIR
jgi:CRISPR-associated protein Cas1